MRLQRPALTAPWIFLICGSVVALASAAGLFGPFAPLAILAIALSSVAAIGISAWRRRPSHIWPWVVIAAALTFFLVGGVLRASLNTMGDLSSSRSLLPDLFVIPGYILLGAGLYGFLRTGRRGFQNTASILLDGLIAALALAAVAWVFAVQPVFDLDQAPLGLKLVMTAYPAASIFLLAITWRIASKAGQDRVPSFWFVLAALGCLLCGDVIYRLEDIGLLQMPQHLLDLPYSLAYVMAGVAAIHVSMRRLTMLSPQQRAGDVRVRIALVAVALFIPTLLNIQTWNATRGDHVVLALLLAALSAVAILRIVQALHLAQRSEARLIHQATHDDLTGLPNRRLMEQHLSQRLDEAPVDGTHVAVLYLDLDRFKLVNDTHGHRLGDELLVELAERLHAHVRPSDLVARIGGDEFMIVLDHVVTISQAVELANRLHACLKDPFQLSGSLFYVSASIGLAFASGDSPDATTEALIRDADTAMYQAKDAGRDGVVVFDASMHAQVAERVELEHDLRDAIANDQLFVVYQPILDLAHSRPVGMEALLRWHHPTHGVIMPSKFIPLAEDSGLIGDIGKWVLDEAVRQLAYWSEERHMRDLYVSVNLSGRQLQTEGTIEYVADTLAIHGLDASSLCLELTESVVMEDPEAAAASLEALRRLGVRVAIDDFGLEYSSLAYLKRFPVSILKIDKTFIDGVAEEDSVDATLVASVVAMAGAFSMTTVAEGVETLAQATRLRELGCDAVQGHFYSRPVGAEELPGVVSSLGNQRLHLVLA
jgi:diguanylate cyclase